MQDVALEAAINYIIRVDESVKGAVLSAAGANGATRQLDGKTYNVANKGERVYLTISDLQEGYDFLYWEGSRYEGGASYKVEGPHSFKAVWKKKEEGPASTAKSEPAPVEMNVNTPTNTDSESASPKTMPATGDTAPLLPITVTLLISVAAFAVIRIKTRRGHNSRQVR